MPEALEGDRFVLPRAPDEKDGGLTVTSEDVHCPGHLAGKLLFEATPPLDADDAFEERLVEACRAIARTKRGLPTLIGLEPELLCRRASLPLTRDRANRLLHEMVSLPRHSQRWVREHLARVAAAADPLPQEQVPPVDCLVEGPMDIEGLALYPQIAGLHAEGRLREWISAPMAGTGDGVGEEGLHRDPFREVLARARALPEFVSAEVQGWLRQEVQKESTGEMSCLLKTGPAWLLSEETVQATALARAETERERWVWSEPSVLPAALLPAVRLRVRSSAPDDQEVAGLLRWLETQGEPLPDLLAAMITYLEGRKPDFYVLRWLASTLSSHTRWRHHGRDIFVTLIDAEAWEQIPELVRLVLSAQGVAERSEERHALVVVLHEAMGRALIEVAERSIERSLYAEAIGALHGLAALRPRTGLRGLVAHLSKAPNLPADVRDLIELNAELLRRDSTREANESDLTTALSLLLEKRRKGAPLPTGADPVA
jgi:hypothetical protein